MALCRANPSTSARRKRQTGEKVGTLADTGCGYLPSAHGGCQSIFRLDVLRTTTGASVRSRFVPRMWFVMGSSAVCRDAEPLSWQPARLRFRTGRRSESSHAGNLRGRSRARVEHVYRDRHRKANFKMEGNRATDSRLGSNSGVRARHWAVRFTLDCVAKVESCRAQDFSRKH